MVTPNTVVITSGHPSQSSDYLWSPSQSSDNLITSGHLSHSSDYLWSPLIQ